MRKPSGPFASKLAAAAVGAALLGATVTPADAGFPAVPAGFKALFTYTEVRTVQDEVSATLHCTNLDFINAAEMRWDVIDADGDGGVTSSTVFLTSQDWAGIQSLCATEAGVKTFNLGLGVVTLQ